MNWLNVSGTGEPRETYYKAVDEGVACTDNVLGSGGFKFNSPVNKLCKVSPSGVSSRSRRFQL